MCTKEAAKKINRFHLTLLNGFFAFTLLFVASTMQSAQAHFSESIQLMPCLNCPISSFENQARNAETGIVYVYDSPEKGVRAFDVMRNDEPNNSFIQVVEVPTDPEVEQALLSVLSLAQTMQNTRPSSDFETIRDLDSVVSLAGRAAAQGEILWQINSDIQSSLGSDLLFLVNRTRYGNMVSQALGWNGVPAIAITFPDGSYMEIAFVTSYQLEDGTTRLEFDVKRIVDSEGRAVAQNAHEYRDWERSGSAEYIGHYESLVTRLGFAVNRACQHGIGGRTTMECLEGEDTCIIRYYHPGC